MNPMFNFMQSQDNKKVLVLMRGLPSSGKSTRAKEFTTDKNLICSADDYFGETNEEYVQNWCIEKLGLAHGACRKKAKMLMQRQVPLVVVDNTNTVFREMMPYVDMAIQYQYRIQVEESKSPWWVNEIAPFLLEKGTHKKHLDKMCKFLTEKSKDTHQVPYQSMVKMMDRYLPNITPEDLLRSFK